MSSEHSIPIPGLVITWPLHLTQTDEALPTVQCGHCGEDILATGGWPAAYRFTVAELIGAINRHKRATSSDMLHDRNQNPEQQAESNKVDPGRDASGGQQETDSGGGQQHQ